MSDRAETTTCSDQAPFASYILTDIDFVFLYIVDGDNPKMELDRYQLVDTLGQYISPVHTYHPATIWLGKCLSDS